MACFLSSVLGSVLCTRLGGPGKSLSREPWVLKREREREREIYIYIYTRNMGFWGNIGVMKMKCQ